MKHLFYAKDKFILDAARVATRAILGDILYGATYEKQEKVTRVVKVLHIPPYTETLAGRSYNNCITVQRVDPVPAEILSRFPYAGDPYKADPEYYGMEWREV